MSKVYSSMTAWQLWHDFMTMQLAPMGPPRKYLRADVRFCDTLVRLTSAGIQIVAFTALTPLIARLALPRARVDRGSASRGSVIPAPGLCPGAMANGTVDFFNDTGGYGFISTDDDAVDDDEDVFFHMEDVGGPELEEGQDVEFEIESSPKGPRATNLERL